VVEHDIDDDLDARPVQRLDHVAELIHRAERVLARAVCLMRGEERDRRIAPVVDLSRRAILRIELEHRQQLDRRDPQPLKVRDLLDQTGESATGLLADTGAGVASETTHMHFVDDSLRRWPAQRLVAFPIVVGRIDHDALHRGCDIGAGLAGGVATVVIRNNHATTVGVEKDLGGIEAHAVGGVPWPFDAIAVDLACFNTRDGHVPVVPGAIGGGVDMDYTLGLRVIDIIEKQQLDRGGILGEHTEVHPFAARRCSQG
jgi:hypothetical protein